jgi:hypothetical protein
VWVLALRWDWELVKVWVLEWPSDLEKVTE